MDIKEQIKNTIQAMGLVFGDIGTSPIYTLTVIFLTAKINTENIISILSLIIWSLILLVTVQYTWLAMSLSKRGEGGTIVLNEVLQRLLKSSRAVLFFSILTYLGISLLIGDSVITPAISILSAVEGLKILHHFQYLPQSIIIIITLAIAIWLFSIQKKGTEKVTNIFGPIMLCWFIFLGISGLISINSAHSVLLALNPLYGLKFLFHNGIAGFFVLSEVVLCVTGAEALYADMGHLGRKPIVDAWYFVFCALILNYLGQGAFLINHPDSQNILFSMIFSQSRLLYIPFLLLSIVATVIASQAMISGLYAIIYQAINIKIFPLLKVDYTSEKINSQIYISSANWILLFLVILIVLMFKESSKLASAYGLAVTATFNITILLMSTIFYLRRKYFHFAVCLFLMLMDVAFLFAACFKIPTVAYWSLIIATIPFSIIILYIMGQKRLFKSIKLMAKDDFLQKYEDMYENRDKIKGTALFFARSIDRVPPYVVQTMFKNGILYSENIFVQINKANDAFGIHYDIVEVTKGLKTLEINAGYMEVLKIERILKALSIDEKAIFYGVEDIETDNFFWHIFAFLKKITPTFVSFYKLPVDKMHGVITQIKL